jgi:adenylate kinase
MEISAQLHRRVSGVLYIKVSDEAIISRLSGRLICRQCQAPYHLQYKKPGKAGVCDSCGGELYQRADDNPNTVRARLVTFHGQTEPLIAYYRRAGLLHEIDGEGNLADISARCLNAVRSFAPKANP